MKIGEMMINLKWLPEYNIGDEIIDQQHQGIFQCLEDLQIAIIEKRSVDMIEAVLKRLVEYGHTHFNDEEEIMKQYCYPDLENHQLLHKQFFKTLDLKMNDFTKSSLMATDLLAFLCEWLTKHILKEDQKIKDYIH